MLGFRNKREMVDSADALPGRDRQMPVPARHEVLGTPLAPPFGDGMRAGDRRDGMLLGRGADFLAGGRRLHDRRRLRGRVHAQPHLRRGVHDSHRPRGGRADRVRPDARLLTPRSCGCSGRTTIRPRACDRATTSARSIDRRSSGGTDEQRVAAEASRDAYAERLREAGYPEITTEITRGGAFLLRGGLPPAISGQESLGLLRTWRDRRELPRRRRRGRKSFLGRSWGPIGGMNSVGPGAGSGVQLGAESGNGGKSEAGPREGPAEGLATGASATASGQGAAGCGVASQTEAGRTHRPVAGARGV